jgi:hypothetical protein
MAKVYVEARPKGRPEGTRIDDYVVEDHADHVLPASFLNSLSHIQLVTVVSSCHASKASAEM